MDFWCQFWVANLEAFGKGNKFRVLRMKSWNLQVRGQVQVSWAMENRGAKKNDLNTNIWEKHPNINLKSQFYWCELRKKLTWRLVGLAVKKNQDGLFSRRLCLLGTQNHLEKTLSSSILQSFARNPMCGNPFAQVMQTFVSDVWCELISSDFCATAHGDNHTYLSLTHVYIYIYHPLSAWHYFT